MPGRGRRKPREICPACKRHEMIHTRAMCDWCWRALPGFVKTRARRGWKAIRGWYDTVHDRWKDVPAEDEPKFLADLRDYIRTMKLAAYMAERMNRGLPPPDPDEPPPGMASELKELGLI